MKKKKEKDRNRHYTFMFFPEGKGVPFTLRIHRYTIYMTAVSIALIVCGMAVLIYKAGEISLKLQLVHNLRQENIRLRQHAKDLEVSSQKIASIDSMTAYLHRLAGVTDLRGTHDAPSRAVPSSLIASPSASTSMSPASFAVSVPNIMPVDGWITKHFSKSATLADSHSGVDIAAASGTPIRATAPGVVEEVGNDKYLGLTVEVRHENGFLTRYSHCAQILVSAGDRVNRGQTIALVGNTGRSTAPHVHYEVLKDGKYVNPMSFIGAQEQ